MRLALFSSNLKHQAAYISRVKDIQPARRRIQRLIHRSALNDSNTTHPPSADSEPVNFEDLGLHPPIVTALRHAFPNLGRPTEAQAKFIPAVLDGRDILLRDFTGSGKCVIFPAHARASRL